ncbi:MAG: 16S rRNA (adenine(1518)-N(6)/adenine(1519)-N(6))-dimethyltransferase RsmA [Candidatus Gracilibacteria bacterium]|nr:16S rRNA (adenine(1518)-N(6)/adenine(1519)-N(6))-dimethyltransferase RsmA [Candidatus Gracilibacteria bacterium]
MDHKSIFKKYNISPKKSLGQNFLIDDAILEKIASYLNLDSKNVVEVGPGYGALTEKILTKNPVSLSLVELDLNMIRIIEDRIKNNNLKTEKTKFEIKNIDVLKYFPKQKNYVVVANIPYYITSPILRHFFFETPNKPSEMLILMQKDVGDKIRKFDGKSSLLSLFADFACEEIKEIIKVGKNNFLPAPKVESSVLYFKLRESKDFGISEKDFFEIIKIAFAQKRKKLTSNLLPIISKEKIEKIFNDLGFNQNSRAEDLDLEKWIELIIKIKEAS